MRRTFAAVAFTAVLASGAASFTLLPNGTKAAAPSSQGTFLVSANDGYGFGDCLTSGSQCGQVVANAWCETQGFSRALAFEPARPGDLTGSVETVSLSSREQAVTITCTR
jgi:hypothetical protein